MKNIKLIELGIIFDNRLYRVVIESNQHARSFIGSFINGRYIIAQSEYVVDFTNRNIIKNRLNNSSEYDYEGNELLQMLKNQPLITIATLTQLEEKYGRMVYRDWK